MSRPLLIALAFSLLAISFADAQDTTFWQKIKIKKAFETKTEDDTKAAIISFTDPKDTLNSFLVNAGIGYDFSPFKGAGQDHTFTGFFVYNRNTLIAKTQKNYKLGIAFNNAFDTTLIPPVKFFGTSSVQYLNNYIDTTHSVLVTSYWHPMYKGHGPVHIGGYVLNNAFISYYLLPQGGIEYQNVVSANSKFKKGYDTRLYGNLTLNFKIKKKTVFTEAEMKSNLMERLAADTTWKKTLKETTTFVDSVIKTRNNVIPKNLWAKLIDFSFSYTHRHALMHHNSNFEKDIPLFTAAVNLYPFNTENFSFGISYNNGANPIDATPKQTYWLFSISFKKL